MTHCWKDEREHIEEAYGVGSDEWHAGFDGPGGTCLLLDGHDGPHEFTPDDEITVSFGTDNVEVTRMETAEKTIASTEEVGAVSMSPSTSLLDAVGQAIVDLSVHPAGCDDWRFYEHLCLEVADSLDIAYQAFKASNNSVRVDE